MVAITPKRFLHISPRVILSYLQPLCCTSNRDRGLDIYLPVSVVSSCLSGSSCGRGLCFLGDPAMRAATNSSSVSHTPPH